MNIKVFTAFSGYDSQCMALDRLHDIKVDSTLKALAKDPTVSARIIERLKV